jgi:3-phosphoglycerate kinase
MIKYDKFTNLFKIKSPMKLKTIKDIKNLKGKTVIVKVDFNVPLKKTGDHILVEDDTRILITIPTIEYLQANNCKIILMSHLGRPDGKIVPSLSLKPIATKLSKILHQPIKLADSVIGPTVTKLAHSLKPKEILLLENNRFEPGETINDPKLSKALASLADIFINDGFSLSHRAHASVVGITKYLPSYAGFTLEKEVTMLSKLTTNPVSPFVAIVGGAKISDKIDAIKNLAKIADVVLVGGGIANNFLKAEGVNIYSSYMQDVVVDEKKRGVDYVKFAKTILNKTRQDKILLDGYIPIPKIVYPIDVIAADGPEKPNTIHEVELVNNHLNEKQTAMYLDIGPRTEKLFKEIILQAKTIFWNGPMGMFENTNFQQGTKTIAKAVASSKATTILGGGDTISAINKFDLADKYDYVSASGGASLEFLGGKKLPGIVPLEI